MNTAPQPDQTKLFPRKKIKHCRLNNFRLCVDTNNRSEKYVPRHKNLLEYCYFYTKFHTVQLS